MPAKPSAGIPPSSSASHVACSSRRCCGSSECASRGRDAEELGVELVYLAEESAAPGDDLADLRRVRIVISRCVPARFGNVAGGVGFAAQQLPEPSAESAPPGSRHPIPTIANGSWRASCWVVIGQLDCRAGEAVTIQSPLTGLPACSWR